MANFSFDPINGLNDNVFFITSPNSEAAARSQFMVLFNQIRDYLNSSTIDAGTLSGKKASDFLLTETANTTYAKSSHSHSGYSTTSHTHDNYSKTSHTHTNYAASSHSHSASECGFSWGTGNPNNSDGKPNGSIYYKIEG